MNQYLDEPTKRDLWVHVKEHVHRSEVNKKSLESLFITPTDSKDGDHAKSPEPSIHRDVEMKPVVTVFRDQNIVSFAINPVIFAETCAPC